MNRFGDDLTQELLQYLPLEQKFRLESVSKQWQRCLYQRVFTLTFDDRRIFNYKTLESVLKKCPNIRNMKLLSVDTDMLPLIGQNCTKFSSFGYYSSIGRDEEVMSFFRTYGHICEELKLWQQIFEEVDKNKLKGLLKYCKN